MPKLSFSASTSSGLRDQVLEYARMFGVDVVEESESAAVNENGEKTETRGRKKGQTKAALEAEKLAKAQADAASAKPPSAPSPTQSAAATGTNAGAQGGGDPASNVVEIVDVCQVHGMTLDHTKYKKRSEVPIGPQCGICAKAAGTSGTAQAISASNGTTSGSPAATLEAASAAGSALNRAHGGDTSTLVKILGQFGVDRISPKEGKRSLPPEMYASFIAACVAAHPQPIAAAAATPPPAAEGLL